MKPILFTTNYSSSSENAGDFAAQLAKACNVPLIVLHSWTIPVLTPEDAVVAPPAEVYHERERLAIDKEVMRLKTRWGITVSGVECQGYTPEEIEQLYKREEVSMVVMGMHHHSFFSRLLGSVATRSIHNAGYPVLLIPDNSSYHTPQKILLAASENFGTNSHCLDPLKLIVRMFNCTLDVVHVSKPEEVWNVENNGAAISIEYLLRKVPHQWTFQSNNDVSVGIAAAADDNHADWIAVVPRHFTWLETLVKRSISEKLAFNTNKPLLILPSEDPVNSNNSNNSTLTIGL